VRNQFPPRTLPGRGDGAPAGEPLKRNPQPRAPLGRAVVHSEDHAGAGAAQLDAVSAPQSSRMFPPLLGRTPYGTAQGTPYAQQSTHEMIQRQLKAAQNMNLVPQYTTGYGNGINPAPAISASRTSVNLGQNDWANQAAHNPMQNSARPSLPGPFGIYQDQQPNYGFQLPNNCATGSYVPSRDASMRGLHVSSRQPSIINGSLSAPESRVSSRQPSHQSSGEQLRLSLNSNASGSSDDDDNVEDVDQLIVTLPLPHELKQKVRPTITLISPALIGVHSFLWSHPHKSLI
jgi:hypothetical protein